MALPCGMNWLIWLNPLSSHLPMTLLNGCYMLLVCTRSNHFMRWSTLVVWFLRLSVPFGKRCAPQPPKNHVFLWLLVNNKVVTRENLGKRTTTANASFLFCNETETVQHRFFFNCVAKHLWSVFAKFFLCDMPRSPLDIIQLWSQDKKNDIFNLVCSASFWSLWSLRNEFCFQGCTGRKCIRLLDHHRGELPRVAWAWLCSECNGWRTNVRP